MKSVLFALCFLGTISQGSDKIYLTPYIKGHPECDRVNGTQMICPDNEINKKQPGESVSHFYDRETEWDLKDEIPPNCVRQNNNILICNTNSDLPPVPLL